MPSRKQTNLLIGSLLAGLLVLILISVYVLTRPQREISRSEAAPAAPTASGFSFFDVHRQTVLSRSLRQTLADQLGRDAIARRGLIDLIVIDAAFTQTHFPELYRYHSALNPAGGGRRKHAITTLTYRRAQQQGLPFKLIRLVFAQDTGNPLYLVIEPADEDSDLFDALGAKYGAPGVVTGDQEGDRALIWKKPDEILAGVSIRRRGGRIDRQVRYYFLSNIKELVAKERAAEEARRRQTDKATQRAF
jgi:hypothetical protein